MKLRILQILIGLALIVKALADGHFNFRTKDLLGHAAEWTFRSTDLLEPLLGCQFILHTGISQCSEFPLFLLDVINVLGRQSYQQLEITTSLKEYVHSRYYLRHSRLCIIHLAFQAMPFMPNNAPLELNFPFASSGIFWVRPNDDLVLLFIDGDRNWDQSWYAPRARQCEAPSTLVVFIYQGLQLAQESFVMLTRRNGQGQTGLYSASALDIHVFGTHFDELFRQVRQLRKDFHGSIVLSRRNFCPLFIPGSQVTIHVLRQCRNGRNTRRGYVLLELGAHMNFSIVHPTSNKAHSQKCAEGYVDYDTTRLPHDSADYFFYPYKFHLQYYSGLQLFYVGDVISSSVFSLRSILAPFSNSLWLLLLSAVLLVGIAGLFFLQHRPNRSGFLFSCFTTMVFQFPCSFERTARLAMLWTLAGFVITNHYLALLQSLKIVPQVLLEEKSYFTLMGTDYKLFSHPQIRNFAESYMEDVKRHMTTRTKLLDDEQILFLALRRDEEEGGRWANQTVAIGWDSYVPYTAEMIRKASTKNAYILRRKFMRTAFWYVLEVPNSDVAMEKFHQLVVTGIESYWLGAELTREMELEAAFFVCIFRDKQATNNGYRALAGSGCSLFGGDPLVLESFWLFVLGFMLSATSLALVTGLPLAAMVILRIF